MGLVVLLVMILYFVLLVGATIATYYIAKKHGWPARWRQLAATGTFLVIFLPVFWDWLPTVWLHSYYCEKYAGLSVYKTPEQWRLANPGVAETLVRLRPAQQVGYGNTYYFQLNQRFRWELSNSSVGFFLVQHTERLVDGSTGEVLVRFLDFSTGLGSLSPTEFRDYKFWMTRISCEPEGNRVARAKFNESRLMFQSLGSNQ